MCIQSWKMSKFIIHYSYLNKNLIHKATLVWFSNYTSVQLENAEGKINSQKFSFKYFLYIKYSLLKYLKQT